MKKRFFLSMLVLISIFTAKAAVVNPNGLILHYQFDGNMNNEVIGVYGAATLVNNAALTTGNGGFSGEALDLTATTGFGTAVGHALLPNDFTVGVTDFTVAIWVKLTDNPAWTRIFDFGNNADYTMFLTPNHDNSGNLRFAIKNDNGEQQIDGPGLPLNEWAHVAVTVKYTAGIGVGTMYVNGTAVKTNTNITNTPDGLGLTTMANFIGRSQFNDQGLRGYVDELCFYSRALSAYDVAKLYLEEGKAFLLQYPFSGSSAETSLYSLPIKYRSDFKEVSLYGSSSGFVLSNETKDVTVTWAENPNNPIMIIGYYFDYSYTDGGGIIQTGTHIYDEHNAAVFGNALSGTYDLYTNGTLNDGNANLSINKILAIDENATITITQIKLNDLWNGAQDYKMVSATVAGQPVQALSSYDIAGWALVQFYSGEFTATGEGLQAFWIDRFEIPVELRGKYVRIDFAEAPADDWGLNFAFEDELSSNAGGWTNLNGYMQKIGNSYYYQIPIEAVTMNPQLWKNSNGDTKNIKVAGFYLTDQINLVVDEDTEFTQNTSWGYVTVNAGKKLTIASGVTFTADVLILKSDAANGTATFVDNGTSTITTAKVEQFLEGKTGLSGREWWYVSSPVNDAKTTLFNSNGNRIGYYSESTASYSSPIAGEENLAIGRGYVLSLAGDDAVYTFSGTLNNGNQFIPVSRTGTTAAKRGFNLVGNPYPSYLDWDAVAKTNVQSTIWTRTFESNNMVFKTYNADAQVGSDDETTAHIAPLQAFWIKVPEEKVDVSSLTLDFTNAQRLHKDISDDKLRMAKAEMQTIVRLQVRNGANSDQTVLVFNENAADAFDKFDSEKMSNDNAAIPEIYTLAGSEKLVINSMNAIQENKEITLGFSTGATSSFTIQATTVKNMGNDLQIILKDKLTDTNFDLTEGHAYPFTSDATNTESRFAIIFAPKTPTEIKAAGSQNQLVVYSEAGSICVQVSEPVKISVYNALGQCYFVSGQSVKGKTTIALPTGIYFVKAGNEFAKVIVK